MVDNRALSPNTPADPLAKLNPDTVRNLVEHALLFIDPYTREFRSTPPARPGGINDESYVSGKDLEEWPGRVARFRTTWDAHSEAVREAILERIQPPE